MECTYVSVDVCFVLLVFIQTINQVDTRCFLVLALRAPSAL